MTQQSKHLYEFGPYRIDLTKRLLLRGEESIQLPSKVFGTLLVLVQHSEEVVSKDDLLSTVWKRAFGVLVAANAPGCATLPAPHWQFL